MNNVVEVSVDKLKEIIETRQPLGMFYAVDTGLYTAVDNRTGDAWTEDFITKERCLAWLLQDNKPSQNKRLTITIPDQDTFRKYRMPAEIEYHTDGKTVQGIRYRYRFPNGYGASVIKRPGSFGYIMDLWELGVTTWGEVYDHLTYTTPITDNVLGYLTGSMVCDILGKIICLPTRIKEDTRND